MTLYGGDDILEKTPKALSIKIIIDNLSFIKIESVCFTKGYYQENEMGHRMGENSFKNISDKELLYKHVMNSIIRKWEIWQKTWANTSSKKIYKWKISVWKDIPYHISLLWWNKINILWQDRKI